MRQYDEGIPIKLTIRDRLGNIVDLTECNKAVIDWTLNGKQEEKEAEVLSPKTNGQIQYMLVAGDLPSAGIMEIYGWVSLTGGEEYTTDPVYEAIEKSYKEQTP